MKNWICLTLTIFMVLGLCACGGGEEDKASAAFQVGYGREVITPNTPMPMGGYGQTDKRIHTNVLDDLMITCVAITDTAGETVLLFSVDLINSTAEEAVRLTVSNETGVPVDHIIYAATHTHSAPDQGNSKTAGFVGTLPVYATTAAKEALADRSEAEIYAGRVEVEGMNFVRHYLMNDGTYAGDNFGSSSSGYKEHAEEGDHEMQLIKFTRAAEDKDDIIMVNWQAHPCITGGIDKTDMSADFVGSTRQYIEYQTDDLFIYFTGAAGNQNAKSYITGETPTTDYQQFGMMLGEWVIKGQENMTKLDPGSVKTTTVTFTGEVDHTMEDKLEEAREVIKLYNATDRETGNKLAHQYGFTSVYHANGVIRRSSMGETMDMDITAFTVGDISFIAAPYEMFAAHARHIKDNSPNEMTFILSCANGAKGYLPTVKAYDFVCYESTTGNFARGTGDLLAAEYVKMLEGHQTETAE